MRKMIEDEFSDSFFDANSMLNLTLFAIDDVDEKAAFTNKSSNKNLLQDKANNLKVINQTTTAMTEPKDVVTSHSTTNLLKFNSQRQSAVGLPVASK